MVALSVPPSTQQGWGLASSDPENAGAREVSVGPNISYNAAIAGGGLVDPGGGKNGQDRGLASPDPGNAGAS
eukprot:1620490-Karenia_brevis.AAC.1